MIVKNYLTHPPKIAPTDLAVKARAVMRKSKVRALPVFDGDTLLGILTKSDLVKITSSRSNIQARDLLWREPIKINSKTPLSEAAKLILKNNIKQLPVYANGIYQGLIRDEDLLRAFVENNKPRKKTVAQVMTPGVNHHAPTDPVNKAWSLLQEHSGFPVVDRGRVVGLVTTVELLDDQKSASKKKKTQVGHIMRPIAKNTADFIVTPSTSLSEAAVKMLNNQCNLLPVVSNTLVGVVTRKDILGGYV